MALSTRERDLLRRGIKPHLNGGVSLVPHHDGRGVDGGNGALTPEQIAAKDILQDALDTQVSLMASGRFDQFRGARNNRFFRAFLADPLFLQVYAKAQQEALAMTDDWEFSLRLRGELFAQMMYAYLSSQTEEDIPISPSDTFHITSALHPTAEVITDPFGNKGLKGKYVPDGYGVGANGKIEKVFEYSGGDIKPRALSQATGFAYHIMALGNLAQNPVFVEFTPRTTDLLAKAGRMPFGRDFYDQFEPFVYFEYRQQEGMLTLSELRQQWHASIPGQQKAKGEPSQAFFGK